MRASSRPIQELLAGLTADREGRAVRGGSQVPGGREGPHVRLPGLTPGGRMILKSVSTVPDFTQFFGGFTPGHKQVFVNGNKLNF